MSRDPHGIDVFDRLVRVHCGSGVFWMRLSLIGTTGLSQVAGV